MWMYNVPGGIQVKKTSKKNHFHKRPICIYAADRSASIFIHREDRATKFGHMFCSYTCAYQVVVELIPIKQILSIYAVTHSIHYEKITFAGGQPLRSLCKASERKTCTTTGELIFVGSAEKNNSLNRFHKERGLNQFLSRFITPTRLSDLQFQLLLPTGTKDRPLTGSIFQ